MGFSLVISWSRSDYIRVLTLSLLLFIIVLVALSKEIWPKCLEELLYANDLAVVNAIIQRPKGVKVVKSKIENNKNWWLAVKMLEKLQKKASFFVVFAEWVWVIISFSSSFKGVGVMRDVVVLEVNQKRKESLNVINVQINKQA